MRAKPFIKVSSLFGRPRRGRLTSDSPSVFFSLLVGSCLLSPLTSVYFSIVDNKKSYCSVVFIASRLILVIYFTSNKINK